MPIEWYKRGLRYIDKGINDYEYQTPKNVKVVYNGKTYESIRQFCISEKIDRNMIRKIRSGKIETPEYLKEKNFQMIVTENEN